MDQPLDLKYRPRRFSDVIGNQAVVRLLLARSKSGTLAGRSMMFGGPKGCGKTTLARIVARAIVCADLSDGEPCGTCVPCTSVSDESSVSFDEFDAATQGTVDKVRSIVDDLDYGSLDGKPRVIILDEAHRLSKPSQDALLKSMEDRRLVVILCTTEPRKIVEAIRSRVEEYPVSPPSRDVLTAHLERVCIAESVPFELPALQAVADVLSCCPRECVCAIDTLRTSGGVNVHGVRALFRFDRAQLVADALTCLDSDPAKCLSILDELSSEGAVWIRDTMVQAISSALRNSVGAKSSFPAHFGFYPARGPGWAVLAKEIGRLDRPTMPDLEACLLATAAPTVSVRSDLPTAAPTPAPSLPPTPTPTPTPTPKAPSVAPSKSASAEPTKATPSAQSPSPAPVKRVKQIELDGVRFTSDESLTSLDDKVDAGGRVVPPPTEVRARVELDQRDAPLTDKEFASGLVRRIKASQA